MRTATRARVSGWGQPCGSRSDLEKTLGTSRKDSETTPKGQERKEWKHTLNACTSNKCECRRTRVHVPDRKYPPCVCVSGSEQR
jgi:hypothetical protein